jgi:hypothetical protein
MFKNQKIDKYSKQKNAKISKQIPNIPKKHLKNSI